MTETDVSKSTPPDPKSPESIVQEFRASRVRDAVLVPLLAVFTGLLIGAVIIVITDSTVITAWRHFFDDPGGAIAATWTSISVAYGALISGSLGIVEIWHGLQALLQGQGGAALGQAMIPLAESMTQSVPYIFAGLAVALGFQGGLFNIGGEGQLLVGALSSVYVGYAVTGLPWFIHLPLALIAGLIGAGIWGAIPGLLKAYTGGHEVINTIMMNWIIISLSAWLLKVGGPMSRGELPITPEVLETAQIPQLFATQGNRFHWGFFLALIVAAFVWWLLYKTTLGFEIRMLGANPKAARYSGIHVKRLYVIVMTVSAMLAGMAGSVQALAVDRWVGLGFSGGLGFDAIALALLGKSHPLGVVLAAILFGTLRNGATRMQSVARVPIDIITIVQALVIVFIAAPAIVRWLFRLRAEGEAAGPIFTKGWGS
ncbi:MAG: ABC transporter permease [Chloroflexi bacterium]|nr:ABC transporter permease [Chloroflexota bacterium]